MKIKMLRVIAISTILSLIACGDDNSAGANSENGAGLPDAGLSSSSDLTQNFETFSSGGAASGDDENDLEDARVLDGSEILLRVAGTTATVENNNGCVVVNNQSATLRSSNSPILVKNAEKTVIHLVKGTNNVVEDGVGDHLYVKVNGEPDTAKAAIYARDDLNIKGAGTLVVTGNGFIITGGVLLAFGDYTTDVPGCASISYTSDNYYGSENAAFKPNYTGNTILYGGTVTAMGQVETAGMTEFKFPNGASYLYR